jgi:redox-sensitive bicupin YhaK (pirin superfamily)
MQGGAPSGSAGGAYIRPMNIDPPTLFRSRGVERIVRGQAASDGDGVRLTRVLTQPLQQRLDPFLMLDAFGSDAASDYVGGFPDHPHRGFETVTIMLEGRMRHRDSVGNVGLLEPGSVQWMTAGRGIIHSEMPEQTEGRMAGFQLWVNLAAADKMTAPTYRDIAPAAVPEIGLDTGVRVRVIAGSSLGTAGAVTRPRTEPIVLDLTMPAGTGFDAELPAGHNAFLYVFGSAAVDVGGDEATRVEPQRMAILRNDPDSTGVRLAVPAAAPGPARVLLVAGRPLREPIAQYGPFVMNTAAELQQAFADFQSGKLAA